MTEWLTGPATEYDVTYTELSVEDPGEGVMVTTLLEGNLPGGVVVLRTTFELDPNGRIAVLKIAAQEALENPAVAARVEARAIATPGSPRACERSEQARGVVAWRRHEGGPWPHRSRHRRGLHI